MNERTEIINPLTLDEQDQLEQAESVIETGQRHFVAVGKAIMEIRDGRLYREDFATFEDYCAERWNWSRQRAYQIIEAAQVVEALPEECQPMVDTERAARELARIEPQSRVEVLERAGETPSASKIRKAAKCQPMVDKAVEEITQEDRATKVSFAIQGAINTVRDAITRLNPTAAELVRFALALKSEARRIETAAESLAKHEGGAE